ncbi:methyltransferase [Deferribacter autotrophicus]|uniref:Methyltransferase n=1 Tax=Deferribacter autotrophicus TaxID=500465 RepID=A0A5A8F6Z3_9BACT|nr:50S ribosomal protein L11 methyltransferase [Deferribacter autotrophicus]KAA0259445.1 methyltransferase [Deferribacter autotrophicus]
MYKYIINAEDIDVLNQDEKLSSMVVEEYFKGNKEYIIYSEEDLINKLKKYNIRFDLQKIVDEDWSVKWKEYLKDGWLTYTTYFTHTPKQFDDRDVLYINPSMAFGTGDHPTTKIAARLLEPLVKDKVVLEVGSGSGILSILSAKKGAKKVFACDNDINTFGNFKENCRLNNVNNIYMWCGSIDSFKTSVKVDIVVANIISSVLLMIKETIFNINPEFIVFSGILVGERETFLKKVSNNYQIDRENIIDGWWGVRLKRC